MGIAYGTTTLHQATKGIVQDGLVFNFDAGVKDSYNGGTTTYSLSGSNNGTLTNGPSFIKNNGGGIEFDGTDEYISVTPSTSNFGITGTSESTLLCALKFYTVTNSSVDNTFLRLGAGGNGMRMYFTRNGRFASAYYNNDWTSSYIPSANTFYYVGFTEDGTGSAKLYVNGSLEDSTTALAAPNTAGNLLYIGQYTGSNYSMDGIIYQAHVYNRVLSSDEISRNFNAVRHRFGI